MSAQHASAPVRSVRLAATVLFVALAVAVAVRLGGRRGPGPPAGPESPPEGRIVDLKRTIRHEEYKDGRLVADVRGATFSRGPDGRNHLKGSVEVVSFGPAGEVLSRLTADEIVYDPGTLLFNVAGRVRIESGGVVLEGESFDYDKTRGLLGTTSGGVFASKALTGRAAEIAYAEREDDLRLGGSFEARLSAAGRAGEAIALAGRSLTYRRSERRGRIEGRAELRGGGSWAGARSLSFVATGDESAIASAILEGEAGIAVGSGPGPGDIGEVRADRIEMAFDRGSGLLASIRAVGSAALSLRPRTGQEILVRSAAAEWGYGPDGAPLGWSVSGGFRAEIKTGDAPGEVLEGEAAAFDAAAGVLRASGTPGRPATFDSPEARVEAAVLSAGPGGGDVEASGVVECRLKPGQGGRLAGFFSAGEAVFVSSDRLVFRGGARSASFSGSVRARQGEEFLLAGELEFSESAGEMRAGRGVATGLVLAGSDGAPARRLEVGGGTMAFSAADRALSFTAGSYVQLPGARLEAPSVSAVLGAGTLALRSLTAGTGVLLSKGLYEGRAEEAFYQAETDSMVLTGRPVLTDGRGGSARGDKLTFDLADDKILVENEGQGRSTTVIRS